MAIKELQHLLDRHGAANMVRFDPLKNYIQCYAHIVDICSSHIITSSTLVYNSYLTKLKVSLDPSYGTCNDLGSNARLSCSDDNDDSDNNQDYKLELSDHYNHRDDSDIGD
jgi:hypothetical protein